MEQWANAIINDSASFPSIFQTKHGCYFPTSSFCCFHSKPSSVCWKCEAPQLGRRYTIYCRWKPSTSKTYSTTRAVFDMFNSCSLRHIGLQQQTGWLTNTYRKTIYLKDYVDFPLYILPVWNQPMDCTENPIYVFPETAWSHSQFLHSRILERFIYCIPRTGLPIWLLQNRQTGSGNI